MKHEASDKKNERALEDKIRELTDLQTANKKLLENVNSLESEKVRQFILCLILIVFLLNIIFCQVE
jgi:hypothetical protein